MYPYIMSNGNGKSQIIFCFVNSPPPQYISIKTNETRKRIINATADFMLCDLFTSRIIRGYISKHTNTEVFINTYSGVDRLIFRKQSIFLLHYLFC